MENKPYKKEILRNIDAPSCGICFEHYNSSSNIPKLLGCAHTICEPCIAQFAQEDSVLCPFCQQHTQQRQNSLKTNFALLEISQEEKTSILCATHQEEILAYCETDHLLLCMQCVSQHREHSFFSLSDPKAKIFVTTYMNKLERFEKVYQATSIQYQDKVAHLGNLIDENIRRFKDAEADLIDKIRGNTNVCIEKLRNLKENVEIKKIEKSINEGLQKMNNNKITLNKANPGNKAGLAEIICQISFEGLGEAPPSLESFDQIIENLNQEINYENQILQINTEDQSKQHSAIANDKIRIFRSGTKRLITVDLNTLQKSEKEINISKEINVYACVVPLPDNKLFCYGNEKNGYYSGDTFIIDHTDRATLYTHGTPCIGTSGVYLDNCVYAFGGFNGNYMSLTEKYDITNNTWTRLVPMPLASGYCPSVCVFTNMVIVSGYKLPLAWVYNPQVNEYKPLPLKLKRQSAKVVCTDNEKAYIIDPLGDAYESARNDITRWFSIGKISSSQKDAFSYKVLFNNSVYFFVEYNLVRFNLNLKAMEVVKEDVKN